MYLINVCNNEKYLSISLPNIQNQFCSGINNSNATIMNSSENNNNATLEYSRFPLLKMQSIWPEVGILFFNNCCNPTNLEHLIKDVLSVPNLKKQHSYSHKHQLDSKIGSYNLV